MILGEKDFQQMFLIKDHIKKNKINTKIIAHKIVRKKMVLLFLQEIKI